MRQFTQDGMFNELSKVTRAINKKKYENMDLPKFNNGGPDEPSAIPAVDDDKDFYKRMVNSPLFVERYARMVGKPVDQVGEEAEAYRQQILNNIETIKINDVGVFPKGVRRNDVEFIDGVYYAPLKKEDIDKAHQYANDLPKLFRKGFLRRINKEIQNYPDHQLFLYDDSPWVKTHELSHGSVKGQLENINVNEYNFKDMSDSLPRTRRYYEGREDYLTDPNEQKARVDVARKYLESKGLYNPINEPFTEKHYKLLQDEIFKKTLKMGKGQGFKTDYDPNLPLDIEELVNPYEEKTVIDMFNNFVSNDADKDLVRGKFGGLAKFVDGGDPIYTYSGRPDSIYKVVNGQWHIKNDSTNGQFIPINDPSGGRTNVLNQHAVKIDQSLYRPKPITFPKMQPSETTQMFQPIVNNAVTAQNLNLARATQERNQNIARGEKAIKQSIASIQNNKNYNQKEKDELLKQEYDRLLDFDNRKQIEETGAILNQLDQQSIKAAPEKTTGDYAERAWDIITNPFDAAKYSISGGGLENMPWNYNKMKEAGIDPSARSYTERFSGSDEKSNLVGNVLNTFNLFDAGDKVYRNAEKGNWEDALLEASRFLEVGAFMKPGTLGKLAKYTTKNPDNQTSSYKLGESIADDFAPLSSANGNYKGFIDYENINGIDELKKSLQGTGYTVKPTWGYYTPEELATRHFNHKYSIKQDSWPFETPKNLRSRDVQKEFFDQADEFASKWYKKNPEAYDDAVQRLSNENKKGLNQILNQDELKVFNDVESIKQRIRDDFFAKNNIDRGMYWKAKFESDDLAKFVDDQVDGKYYELTKNNKSDIARNAEYEKIYTKLNEHEQAKDIIRQDIVDNLDPDFKRKIEGLYELSEQPRYPTLKKWTESIVPSEKHLIHYGDESSVNALSSESKDYLKENVNTIGGVRMPNGETITLGSTPAVGDTPTFFIEPDRGRPVFMGNKRVRRNPVKLSDPNTWGNIFEKKVLKPQYKTPRIEDYERILVNVDNQMMVDPQRVSEVAAHEEGHTQQRIADWADLIQEHNSNFKYYTNHDKNELSKAFKDAMVEPKLPGTSGYNVDKYDYETWKSGVGELHSELNKSRLNAAQDYMKQGYTMDEAIQILKNLEAEGNDELYEYYIKASGNLDKHFKPNVDFKTKKTLLQILPMVGATVLTGNSLFNNEESPLPKEQKFGGNISNLQKFLR